MTTDRLIAGRYRLSDPIGSGAMGVVWRAEDVRLRRTVAVKQLILAPGLSKMSAMEAKLRAMREGRIAARLHHPNAITVFDVAEEDGQPWLVMEYMNAPSLAAKLAGNRTLPPVEVAKIGAQAAAALAAAHDAGIVHRDVKPANLLVADDGTVKITDFGISRAVGDITVTATGFLAGTPAYLAPEVARGEDPEPASDVFALGSTLYTAVQGAPPFGENENPLALLHAVGRGQAKPPENAGPLGPVLTALLTPTVEGRPTMHDAQKALAEVAAGRTPAAPPPAPTKVLPAPGAAATALLPEPKGEALGESGEAAGATASTAPPGSPSGPGEFVGPAAASGGAAPSPSTGSPPGQDPIVPFVDAAAPSPTKPARSAEVRRNRLIAVGAAAAVVLLVLVGIALASLAGRDGGEDDRAGGNAPASVTSAAPQPAAPGSAQQSESAEQTTTTAKPSTSSATPSTTAVTTTPSGPPSAESVAAFVQGYYATVPGDVAAGWSQLTPAYQAQTGGFDAYTQFWSTIRSVSVGQVRPSGSDRAVASLTYRMKDGSTSSEQRWFQVSSQDGRLLIAASGT